MTGEKQPSCLLLFSVCKSLSPPVAPTAVDSGPPSLCSLGAFAVGTPMRCWSSNSNKGQLARQQAGVILRCSSRKRGFFFPLKTNKYIYFFM